MWYGSLLLSLCLLLISASAASAQQEKRNSLSVTVAGGGVAFSTLQTSEVVLAESDGGLARLERRISAETSAGAGMSVVYRLRPRWGLRGHVTYVPSRFQVLEDRSDLPAAFTPLASAPPEFARVSFWLFDGGVLVDLPSIGAVTPYAVAGVGGARYVVEGGASARVPADALPFLPPGADRWQWGASLGVGAAVPLRDDGLALVFELTDHVTRTAVAASQRQPEGSPQPLSSLTHSDQVPGSTGEVRFANMIRFMVGFRLPLLEGEE